MKYRPKRSNNKYKAKRVGKYKSKLESIIAKRLGKKGKYEPTRIAYMRPGIYVPDYLVTPRTKSPFFLEVKGYLRSEDQAKMRAVKMTRPDLDIRFFFAQEGKIQGSKLSNISWCQKHGFQYAVGEIPRSWLQ